MLPEYTKYNCDILIQEKNPNEENPQVEGQLAGGYAGAMQSGQVDNSTSPEAYAVYGLKKVKGESHAGGFAGKIDAGAAASSEGLNLLGGILNLDISQLLHVLECLYTDDPIRRCEVCRAWIYSGSDRHRQQCRRVPWLWQRCAD